MPHSDHIEMSGEQTSLVLRWGVDDKGAFQLERSLVFPMLRVLPNDTHASLMSRLATDFILDDDKEGSATLNNEDLSLGTGCGTFELYPTKNIYQFLLLDKVTGRRWHVQWGFESSKRWIKRIY